MGELVPTGLGRFSSARRSTLCPPSQSRSGLRTTAVTREMGTIFHANVPPLPSHSWQLFRGDPARLGATSYSVSAFLWDGAFVPLLGSRMRLPLTACPLIP